MLDKFLHFILQNNLLQKRESALLAVSGGVDSVALCKLFSLAAFPFGIAHCNFKLRGNDSDADKKFVEELALSLKAPFFSIEFDTAQHAGEKGISIEMAARELRYAWLEQIRKQNSYHKIATAHHRDDSIETVLLNLVKGTGISGLHGILPLRDKIIRPMLAFGKEEIIAFATAEKLTFRQDRTNLESVYQRNFLRNEVIPKLKELNPSFPETFAGNIEKFKDAEVFFKKGLAAAKKKLIEARGEEQYISIKNLLLQEGSKTILYDLLRDFGFGEKQTEQIYERLNDDTSKQYLSEKHRVIQHRDFLIITKKAEEQSEVLLVENINKPFKLPNGVLNFHLMAGAIVKEQADNDIACFDFDQLQFPLLLRRWKQGDYFYPQGMNGKKKKLSDFFTDNKLSVLEKEKVWVLESGEKIAWIAGYRIDERFKVTPHTKQTLVVKRD